MTDTHVVSVDLEQDNCELRISANLSKSIPQRRHIRLGKQSFKKWFDAIIKANRILEVFLLK